MEGPAFDIYEWETTLPDVHKSAASKLSSMKPNISFHLVFCFPYWLSYPRGKSHTAGGWASATKAAFPPLTTVNPQAFMWQNTGDCKLWMGVSSHMAHVQPHDSSIQRSVVRPHSEKINWGTRSGQYNIFLPFPLSGVRHLEGLDSTHTTVTSVSPVSVTAYSSCLGISLETLVLLRLHVRDNSVSGSCSRDLAPKYQTLQHFTSRLLNFSNLTLSHSNT